MTATLSFNRWTHPGNGQVRRYVNHLPEVIGLEIDYYKSGNVRSASLNGNRISNREASALLMAKVWVHEDGVSVTINSYTGPHSDLILDKVRAAL